MVLDFTQEKNDTEKKKGVKRYFTPAGKKVLVQFTNKEQIDWTTLYKKLGFELVDRSGITY